MYKALAFALSVAAVPPASSRVVVHVDGFRSASGRTICQLFSHDAGFPETRADVVVEASIEKVRGADGTAVLVSRCEFTSVVAGTWGGVGSPRRGWRQEDAEERRRGSR
jgi:uncharacterized protein (DUF2141 family)